MLSAVVDIRAVINIDHGPQQTLNYEMNPLK